MKYEKDEISLEKGIEKEWKLLMELEDIAALQ